MKKMFLIGVIVLICAGLIGAVSAVVITESPSNVIPGQTITIDTSGLADNAEYSLIIDATIQVTPGENFLFETTNIVMPIALNNGQISATTNGAQEATFSAKKGTTEILVNKIADASGVISFTQAQSVPTGAFDFIRLEGTPLPGKNSIISSIQLRGKKSGSDSSHLTFAVNGIENGRIQVSVYVDGNQALYKTVTIGAGSITVTAPNGGETWQRGTSHKVTWSYSGNPGSPVKIVLLKGGSEVGTIANSAPIGSSGTGSYAWLIPSTGTTGNNYQISVQSISQPAIKDVSNNYFTLTPAGTITVKSPNGGESFVKGSHPTITWTSSGAVGSYVKMELLKGSTVVQTLSSSTPNDGSFVSWTIPTTLAPGSDYKIRITSTTNPAITDTSDNYFTITSATTTPSITVMSPNGGETWYKYTTHTITWTYTGNPGPTVKIVLLKGGTPVDTINSVPIGSSGKGSYSWWIKTSYPSGSDYKVSVQSTSQSTIKDTSNANFGIRWP